MTYEHILYDVSGRVAILTLHRPEKRNALNAAMVTELQAALDAAAKDPAVKVIVLKGSGEAFCAGADLESLQQLQKNTREENLADSRALMALMKKIYYHDKIIIAQVEGHAIAGGCGLVTLCDLSYAVPEAKLGYTEVKIGFIPALVSVFLVRKIGEGRARELLLTGRLITAGEAATYGLITQAVPAEEIGAHVARVAEDLCNNASGNSLKVTKRLITRVYDLPLDEALEHAAAENAVTREHADCQRGIQAFLDRQKLTW